MPLDTPEWGKQLLLVLKNDFRTLTQKIDQLEILNTKVSREVSSVN